MRHIVELCAPKLLQLAAKNDGRHDQKKTVLAEEKLSTATWHSASRQVKYIVLEHSWLAEYIGKKRKETYGCSIP